MLDLSLPILSANDSQIFFAWRVYTILDPPYKYVGLFCIATRSSSIPAYVVKYKAMLATLLSAGAAIDIIIALSMLWFFMVRRRQALKKVARLLDRLVAYTIRTGLFTSVTAVSIVITLFASPNTFVWLAMYTFLAKLYSTSLLSALNARTGLPEVASSPKVSRSRSTKSLGRGMISTRPVNNTISIQMKTTTELAVDSASSYPVDLSQDSSHGSQPKDKHSELPTSAAYHGPYAV
ncbi:hypothetical protein EST38_g8176 [Candolleomyces aberdarensis]|uniref:DUF6534 domain-containing protein n=1 Tax=Candolleomyces aberdarensis TaxID=2316362 RepID=A0A4Q2DF16_9AGAR|nr:hypothetical protein EST38_g8176 [Candolleomyces aberdarensis]